MERIFPPYNCATNPLSCSFMERTFSVSTILLFYRKDFPPYSFTTNLLSCSFMERTILRTVVLQIHYPALLWKGRSSVKLCYKSTTLLFYAKDFPPYSCAINLLSCSFMERTILRTVVLQIHYPALLWKGLSSVELCYQSTTPLCYDRLMEFN
jgi:hypothetical protein